MRSLAPSVRLRVPACFAAVFDAVDTRLRAGAGGPRRRRAARSPTAPRASRPTPPRVALEELARPPRPVRGPRRARRRGPVGPAGEARQRRTASDCSQIALDQHRDRLQRRLRRARRAVHRPRRRAAGAVAPRPEHRDPRRPAPRQPVRRPRPHRVPRLGHRQRRRADARRRATSSRWPWPSTIAARTSATCCGTTSTRTPRLAAVRDLVRRRVADAPRCRPRTPCRRAARSWRSPTDITEKRRVFSEAFLAPCRGGDRRPRRPRRSARTAGIWTRPGHSGMAIRRVGEGARMRSGPATVRGTASRSRPSIRPTTSAEAGSVMRLSSSVGSFTRSKSCPGTERVLVDDELVGARSRTTRSPSSR